MFHGVYLLVLPTFSHVVFHVELLLKPCGVERPYFQKFALVLRARMQHAVTVVLGGVIRVFSSSRYHSMCFFFISELIFLSFFCFFSFFCLGKKCTRSWLSSLLFAALSLLSSLCAYELFTYPCACLLKKCSSTSNHVIRIVYNAVVFLSFFIATKLAGTLDMWNT